MKKVIITILKLIFGILTSGLTLFALVYLFQDLIHIHNLSSLKWPFILTCFLGFYLSGIITKTLSLKYIPILAIQFLLFYLVNKFFFPFNIVLVLFALFGLFLARKELRRPYKILTSLLALSIFLFYLFSQPLIIEKRFFGETLYGDYVNAELLWDFNNNQKTLPDLSFYNEKKERVNLSEFSGKKKVITFWATRCGPCLAEKPELEKIKAEFENNENIVFIDISLDKNAESWKSYLKKKKPKGIQLISRNIGKDRSALAISGIPFRVIANEKGNYKECRILPFLREILKKNDTILDNFINHKKKFVEYTPSDKEREGKK